MGCELAGASGCKLADPAVNGGKGVMKLLQDSIDVRLQSDDSIDVADSVRCAFQTIYDLHKAKQTQLTGLQVRFGIHQALYHPDEWASFANVDASDLLGNLTQIQATGVRKGNGASRRHTSLFRHFFSSVKPRQLAVNGAPSNTMDMITCGDSVDSTTTTKQVFDELLRVTQNVSGTCEQLTHILLNRVRRLLTTTILSRSSIPSTSAWLSHLAHTRSRKIFWPMECYPQQSHSGDWEQGGSYHSVCRGKGCCRHARRQRDLA